MSSDNGVYILHTKDGYRVTHAQAIDNIYWWKTGRISKCKECFYNEKTDQWEEKDLPEYEERTEINPEELINYFGHCKIFKLKEEALKEALKLYEEIINDSFCPICEYGICEIYYDKEFPVIIGEENE